MIDITHKHSTYREAIASARVQTSGPETIEAVMDKKVPKGDVLEAARTAGLFGIKRTSDMIPDCHPLPIEKASVNYEIGKDFIEVIVEVATVYKTGVEVEAMHGASIVALTIYDMLKPIDKGVSIQEVKLVKKKGGKSSFKEQLDQDIKTSVVVISDSVSKGTKEDKAGRIIESKLKEAGVSDVDYSVIPDDVEEIQSSVKELVEKGFNLILLTGGTGLSPKDFTPEAIRPMLDKEIPGIMEVARNYGQDRMPYAMLSRGIAGMIGNTLIITMPGSSGGARETMDALFPFVMHIFKVQEKAFRHGL